MITKLGGQPFDTAVEPSDWRYAAAIVGLEKYLVYNQCAYKITEDALFYSSKDINEKDYLAFVEWYYDFHNISMPHKELERYLYHSEFLEDDIKAVNELLKNTNNRGNTVIKKVFSKQEFDGTNKSQILNILNDNRELIIKETFRNKKNMYANYANTGQLFEDGKDICRLLGYYVDGGRKTKSISYNFEKNSFVAQDSQVFDFIPFAFLGGYETFFINDSYNVKKLINTNRAFRVKINLASDGENINTKKVLFDAIRETADFIDYDVEVITKSRDCDFFETMYIRKDCINILRLAEKNCIDFDVLASRIKVTEDYYIDVQQGVINAILNLIYLDDLIELCLKEKRSKIVKNLIKINALIRKGGNDMNQAMNSAYACAKEVVKTFEFRKVDNKIESYRTKLISAVIAKDYDRFCQILLQLSNYAGVTFNFAYDLFENFEENKDLAYTFVNALEKQIVKNDATSNFNENK